MPIDSQVSKLTLLDHPIRVSYGDVWSQVHNFRCHSVYAVDSFADDGRVFSDESVSCTLLIYLFIPHIAATTLWRLQLILPDCRDIWCILSQNLTPHREPVHFRRLIPQKSTCKFLSPSSQRKAFDLHLIFKAVVISKRGFKASDFMFWPPGSCCHISLILPLHPGGFFSNFLFFALPRVSSKKAGKRGLNAEQDQKH